MGETRKRTLEEQEIGRDYRIDRNPVFLAYDHAFRLMFEEFNGMPKGEHQKKWYVGRRWNRRTNQFVETGDAESRLSSFLDTSNGGPSRTLRVIYGRTGSGKTTFLRYFFNTYLPEKNPDLHRNLAPIIIDCADAAVAADMLEQDVDRRIHDALRTSEQFKWLEDKPHFIDMWNEECDFDKLFYIRLWSDMGPGDTEKEKLKRIEPLRSDFHNFNRVRINYLIKNGITPVIVWDNLDHAPIEVQRQAIQLARHKLAWMPGAKVIIAVREYTYPLVQQEIAPAAYLLSDQELFPPDIHSLLQRRMASAVERLATATPSINVGGRYSVALAHPQRFLQIVLESLEQQDITDAMCHLSADNMRQQLLMASRTLRSGHIPIELISSMVESYTGLRTLQHLSWRRFMQGLICGDYLYHRYAGEDASLVLNVFECFNASHPFANSLCMPRLLTFLSRIEFATPLSDLLANLESSGYPLPTLRQGVHLLAHSSLIQSPQGQLPSDFLAGASLPNPFMVSCTTTGKYYCDRLIKELVYVQQMAVVTSLSARWQGEVQLWRPKDVKLGAQAAGAMIGQIHEDEKREMKEIPNGKAGTLMMAEYGCGRLAHDMAEGCKQALGFIQSAWKRRGVEDALDWKAIKAVVGSPGILRK